MSPPRLTTFVAAEGVAIDQLSGRVTAFNVIDAVFVSAIPSMLMRLTTASFYELGDTIDTFTERVRVIDPGGETVQSSSVAVSLSLRASGQLPNGHRSVHSMWQVKLNVAGDYRVILERTTSGDRWDELASLPLTVVVQPHSILNSQAPSVSVPPVPPTSAPADAAAPSTQVKE